ncbi:MAG: methylated-DNA--[protein]-cysteine S-methyltransferase [Kiloniellales bacterium]
MRAILRAVDGLQHFTQTLDTPVGRLALTEAGGALLRIAWADREAGDPLAAADETPLLDRAAAQLREYFANKRRAFDLPLAPEGTAFQRRVWTAMARIPWGETRSYGALARDVGSAARAVGGACGANPIPIVIPCHRVLATGGGLGGYSGGLGPATKTLLLELEGVMAPAPDLFAPA